MIKINKKELWDKIYACWIGKNIGGTMGGPYEGVRSLLDIKGFATEKGEPLPNDDLDLQIVWLRAVEKLGPYNINSKTLGETWLSFVGPHWNEYGIGKANMKCGLLPPLSGDYRNDWKNSNGAWIRTEIWACLAPANPDIAAYYAFEDACVDHGIGEGTYAAMFVAAIESAAFIIGDIRRLIDIGLSKIPDNCRTAQSIRLLLKLYDEGKSWKEARNAVLELNSDIGDGWFEAPSNVTYAILGILYGNGDFKKSMITAVNCGDDTDCTAATVGSILGIIGGQNSIPDDWKDYIGDKIITISIERGVVHHLPDNCSELTDRVFRLVPHMLFSNYSDTVICNEATDFDESDIEKMFSRKATQALCDTPLNSFRIDFNYASCVVSYDGDADIKPNGKKVIHLHFINNYYKFGRIPYMMNLRWILPDGWFVDGPKCVQLLHPTAHSDATSDVDFTVFSSERTENINRIILEITTDGRPTAGLIPITLMG